MKRSEIAIDHNMPTANNMDELRKVGANYCRGQIIYHTSRLSKYAQAASLTP